MSQQFKAKLLIACIICFFSIFHAHANETNSAHSDQQNINHKSASKPTITNHPYSKTEGLKISDIPSKRVDYQKENSSINRNLSSVKSASSRDLTEEYLSIASNAISNWIATVGLIFAILSILLALAATGAYKFLLNRLENNIEKHAKDAHAKLLNFTESYSKCSIYYASAIRKRALAGIYLNLSYSFWKQSENSPDDHSEKSEWERNFKSAIVYGKFALEQSEKNISTIDSKEGRLARQFGLLTDDEIENWRRLNLAAKSNLAYFLSELSDETSIQKALQLAKAVYEETINCRDIFNGKWIHWYETYAHVLLKSKNSENENLAKGIIYLLQNDAKEIDSEWVDKYLAPKYKDLLS